MEIKFHPGAIWVSGRSAKCLYVVHLVLQIFDALMIELLYM